MSLPEARLPEEGLFVTRFITVTEPLDNHRWEIRCRMRDPDGYLIEVG